ncbi:MAG: hypothetical protein PF570_02185 [Candidatus Cloacimonetes bacterium]|jgi:hypothetical protein|nr:hypothetical protein [Candidatus Cloacimonadota bacterium]
MKFITKKNILLLITVLFSISSLSCDYIKLKYISKLKKELSIQETYKLLDGGYEKEIPYETYIDDQLEIHSIIIDPDKFKARYLLLFRNSKLEYWGFPHEFARHSDPLYNAVSEYAITLIFKEEKLEEQKLEEQREKEEIGKRRKHY